MIRRNGQILRRRCKRTLPDSQRTTSTPYSPDQVALRTSTEPTDSRRNLDIPRCPISLTAGKGRPIQRATLAYSKRRPSGGWARNRAPCRRSIKYQPAHSKCTRPQRSRTAVRTMVANRWPTDGQPSTRRGNADHEIPVFQDWSNAPMDRLRPTCPPTAARTHSPSRLRIQPSSPRDDLLTTGSRLTPGQRPKGRVGGRRHHPKPFRRSASRHSRSPSTPTAINRRKAPTVVAHTAM